MNKTFLSTAEEVARNKEVSRIGKKYRIHPRHAWVLVKTIQLEQVITKDGLIIDKSQSRTLQAEVIEFGPLVKGLVAGQVVLVSAFGMEMEDLEEMTGEKGLLMLRDEEVYADAELLPQATEELIED